MEISQLGEELVAVTIGGEHILTGDGVGGYVMDSASELHSPRSAHCDHLHGGRRAINTEIVNHSDIRNVKPEQTVSGTGCSGLRGTPRSGEEQPP